MDNLLWLNSVNNIFVLFTRSVLVSSRLWLARACCFGPPDARCIVSRRVITSLLVKCNNKKSVKNQWIKAHAGIKGNELADRGAKDAHQNSDITMFPLCVH